MTVAQSISIAITFVWLGMVLAISFVEAPLKFRAPGVSLQVGLGIGRLVFRALNSIEVGFAAILIVALAVERPSWVAVIATGVAVVTLAAQLIAVRPALNRRSDVVLATPPVQAPTGRSRAHYGYVALELVKVIALIVGGITLLA